MFARLLDHPRTLAFLVAGAFFMEFLDGTVIATALPQMAVSFGVRANDVGIGMSAYLLTLALLLPASGYAADRFGARPVFATAIIVFTLASIACGLSPGLGSFVLARIIQGAGGALMVPVGRLVVLRTTAKSDLMRAIAILTWPALAAPIIAPPLGGFFTAYSTWRWIFFINVPLGLIGLALALRVVPRFPPRRDLSFDTLGFILTGLACLALMVGVDMLGGETIHWPAALAAFALGLGLGLLALRQARRAVHPILDLSGLSAPTFAVSIIGGSIFRIAVSTVPFLLPLMFQIGFGFDAFHSGLLVLALFVGNLLMKPMTSAVLRRFGFRTTMVGNGILAAVLIAACALLRPQTPVPVVLVILLLGGMARSMGLTAINTIAFADIPPQGMSGANSLFNVVQQMSLGMGIAAGAVILRFAELWRPAGAAAATPLEFSIAFGLVGLLTLLSVLDAALLPEAAGAEVARR